MKRILLLALKVVAYVLTAFGVVGYFLFFRSILAFLAIVLGVVLFGITEIETLKRFKSGDTKKDMFGITVIDFDKIKRKESQKTEAKKTELKEIHACAYCGTEYNPSDYRQDASEWLCVQCGRVLQQEQ